MKRFIKILCILMLAITIIQPVIHNVSLNVYAETEDEKGGEDITINGVPVWYVIDGQKGTSQAWNKFVAKLQYQWQGVEANVIGRFQGLWGVERAAEMANSCKTSQQIYYTTTDYNGLTPNGGYWANQILDDSRSFKWANQSLRDPDIWSLYLSESAKGNTQWNSTKVVLICTSGFVPPIPPDYTEDCTRKENTYLNDNYSFTGVYSVATTLAPIRPVEYSTWSTSEKAEWDSKHQNQSSGVLPTAFGQWVDANWATINNLKNLPSSQFQSTWNTLQAQANAILSSNYIVSPNIDLSTQNQQGFAEGGAFTVTEHRRNFTVTADIQIGQERVITCTKTMDGATGLEKSRTESVGSWYEVNRVATNQNLVLGTLSPIQYWQMLNVRCNKNAINTIKSLLGSAVTDMSLDGNAKGSQTLFTKIYTNMNDLPFGNSSHANTTLRQTAYETFYTSFDSCDDILVCSVSKQATSSNDSKNNVGGPGTGSNTGLYGSQSNGETTSVFTYFRDNVEQSIRLDLWYPLLTQSASDIKHDSRANAVSTRTIFDSNGTPMDETFTFMYSDRTNMKNGSQLASNNTITTNGETNKYIVSSAWASENGKPHKINTIWAYKPIITNRVYTKVNGSSGTRWTSATTTDSTINAYCDSNYNTVTNQPIRIENNWRTKTLFSTYTSFNNAANKYLQINFMRAVAE